MTALEFMKLLSDAPDEAQITVAIDGDEFEVIGMDWNPEPIGGSVQILVDS